MKKAFWLMMLFFIAWCLSLWAYPVYKIGEKFSGIDKSASKNPPKKYIYEGTVSDDVFKPVNIEHEKVEDKGYKLYKCYYPEYLRLEDSSGNTVWKTTELTDMFPEDSDGDTMLETPEDYTEYRIDASFEMYDVDGALLRDIKTKQRVLKKFDGTEIRLPLALTDYNWVGDFLPGKWLCYNYWPNKTLDIAIVNFSGVLERECHTNMPCDHVEEMQKSYSDDRILIDYAIGEEKKFMIISSAGELIKTYPDLIRDYHADIYPNAPNYATVRLGDSDFLVVDIRDGDVKAEIIGSCIDITQVDNSLIGVIGFGPYVAVLDILSGKLIQDLTNYDLTCNKKYEIVDVKISSDSKDIWVYEKYSKNSAKTKHYRIEN